MSSKLVSLKYKKYEKQYREFFNQPDNYNLYLKLCGSAPKSPVEIKKQLKTS